MSTGPPVVHVVDDDAAVRESLAMLLRAAGLTVAAYADARAFLEAFDVEQPGCVIADLRMPGIDGLELQQRLLALHASIPVIVITGHGDVPAAVRALKAGAVDFVEKPFDSAALVEQVTRALGHDTEVRESAARRASLTPREEEILVLVVAGKASKVIAAELGISERTVELHRHRVMKKMQVRSVAELVRAVLGTGSPAASS
ncbi:MAG: response regulator [Gammaproteobacteria bacterium]|nr:response regulator [Gammaproteobacteria bacterium]